MEKSEVFKKKCTSCPQSKPLKTGFYISNSQFDADGRTSVCRDCYKKQIDYSNIQTIKNILQEMNRPFLSDIWNTSEEEGNRRNRDIFGLYIKNIQMNRYKDLSWNDSDDLITDKENNNIFKESCEMPVVLNSQDEKNKEDVLIMIGYDPFVAEPEMYRKNLYNKLVDFLDESTLEDSFKLPAVIEIVKSYNQIDQINSTISSILSDVDKFASNVGGITSLVNSKEKMLKSILALAKDNGISANHNNNKSKGSGTLSGIIKQLHEKGIDSAEINVYDIATCEGMKQVADISNRSIMDQLMLNENDYSEMIKDQRELIESLREKCNRLEEENRLYKIKIKNEEG